VYFREPLMTIRPTQRLRDAFAPLALTLVLGALTACARGEVAPVDHRMSEAELAALPLLDAADGRLVCTATGRELCPLGTAIANRFGSDRIALWEPGRQVLLLDSKNPSGRPFGAQGLEVGQYSVALAVGPFKGGIAVVDGRRNKLVQLNLDGDFEREDDLPPPTVNAAPGFIGELPVLQTIRAEGDSGVAHLRVEILASQRERGGTLVLDTPVPWLRMRGDSAVSFTPLFAPSPVYAVDQDQTIVWAPGDSFRVERRTFAGKVKWRLSSDRRGVAISADDIERRRQEIVRNAPVGQLRLGELDSMTAVNGPEHPVISGILLEPNGRLLVAGSIAPSRDSVEYLLLDRDGRPTNRFSMLRRTRPLVFSGDSMLVHRPTEGEPWEVRWIVLKPAKSATTSGPQ